MRLQYVAVVAATALAATTDGLQVVPNSAKSTSLRASADVRYPPYVEGQGDRFLISEAKNDAATKAPTGYEFSALQEEENVSQLQEEDYEDDSEGSDSSASDEDESRRRKKKKKKKSKATETPTPTPTPTGTGTPQPTPTGTGTPAPSTEAPSPAKRFVSWFKRVFGD